jgi:hypothetical protein
MPRHFYAQRLDFIVATNGTAAVRATLTLSCQDLGLATPGFPVRVRFLRISQGWSIALWSPQAPHPADLVRWGETFHPTAVRTGRINERVVWLDAPHLGPALERLLAEGRVLAFEARPTGEAVVIVEGAREEVLRWSGDGHVAVASAPPPTRNILTDRQAQALEAAAAAGYYRIPRPTNLRQLAAQMGITSAALSELLRRAEAQIILDYLAHSSSPSNPPPPARDGDHAAAAER